MLNLTLKKADNVAQKKEINAFAWNLFCKKVESIKGKNQPYIILKPTSTENVAGFIVTISKRGEGTDEFTLLLNQEIFDVVQGYLLSGELEGDISEINPYEGLKEFAEECPNFALDLYKAEIETEKSMNRAYLTGGLKITSFYKHGAIVYEPYRNEEFKNFILEA